MISQELKHHHEEDPKMEDNETMNESLLPQLPEEIIMEIHSRLPPISLLKFRCVSKSWSVLYNNPKLIDMMQINFSLMIQNHIDLYSINSESLSSSSLLDGMEKTHFPDVEYHSFVGCCNGLVCLQLNQFPSAFSLWNPSTGDCKPLPNPPDQFEFDASLRYYLPVLGYGLGYDPKSDDYKFVCFTTDLKLKTSAVQIYSLRSDSWKQEKRTHNIPWLLSPVPENPQYGVFCNGALHWKSFEALIALCMTDEVIRAISAPENSNVDKIDDRHTCIDVVDGCLSMLYCKSNLGFEVWLMKDYGKKESWTKMYSISTLTSLGEDVWLLCLRRIRRLNSGELLLEVGYNINGPHENALVLYHPKNETSTTLMEDEDEGFSHSISFQSYVKSSVSVSSGNNAS